MGKRAEFIFFVFLVLVFVDISFASAKILFNNGFEETYNFEEIITINFSIEKQTTCQGFIETFLDCEKEVLVNKKYSQINADKRKYFILSFPASEVGECSVRVDFDKESESSSSFEISDEIIVNFGLNNKFFFPSEEIHINGTAIKKNGDKVDGVVNIFMEGIVNKSFDINNGKFLASFFVTKDALPKSYGIKLLVIEKNSLEEIINFGEKTKEVEILGKPSFIEIISKEDIKPYDNVSFTLNLLDQAENFIEGEEVIVKIFDPIQDIVFQDSVVSGNSFNYVFEDNALRGGWNVRGYYGSITVLKPLYIQENKKLKLTILNDTSGSYLLIENTGNIDYEGIVNIKLNNNSYEGEIPINLNLSIGKGKEVELDFEGTYNVSIFGSDLEQEEFQNFYLTGASVLGDFDINSRSYFWIFLLIILVVVFYFLIKKRKFIKDKIPKLNFFKKISFKKQKSKFKEKKVYCAFFKFESPFELEKEVKTKPFVIRKINDRLYYTLFYSYKNKSLELLHLVNKLKKVLKNKNIDFSISLNLAISREKLSFLKEFVLITRKMTNFAKNKILVSEEVLNELNFDLKENFKKSRILLIENKPVRVYY